MNFPTLQRRRGTATATLRSRGKKPNCGVPGQPEASPRRTKATRMRETAMCIRNGHYMPHSLTDARDSQSESRITTLVHISPIFSVQQQDDIRKMCIESINEFGLDPMFRWEFDMNKIRIHCWAEKMKMNERKDNRLIRY